MGWQNIKRGFHAAPRKVFQDMREKRKESEREKEREWARLLASGSRILSKIILEPAPKSR